MKLGINSPRFADFCFLTRLDFNEEDGDNNNEGTGNTSPNWG
jgi:hypothetical protein